MNADPIDNTTDPNQLGFEKQNEQNEQLKKHLQENCRNVHSETFVETIVCFGATMVDQLSRNAYLF